MSAAVCGQVYLLLVVFVVVVVVVVDDSQERELFPMYGPNLNL